MTAWFSVMMITSKHRHHHHCAAVVSRGWAKASACRLQVSLYSSYDFSDALHMRSIMRCPLPYRVAPVFVQVISSLLSLVVFSYMVSTVDVPCPWPLHLFSHCRLCLWLLFSPWPRCWSFCPCMWFWSTFFHFGLCGTQARLSIHALVLCWLIIVNKSYLQCGSLLDYCCNVLINRWFPLAAKHSNTWWSAVAQW